MISRAPAHRDVNLRRMARKHGCQMRVAMGCRGDDTSTTVLAHSNSLADGKGMALKAHDHLGVYACVACHVWLDQGPAPAAEKEAALRLAQDRQVALYRDVAESITSRPADRASALWALSMLRP